MPRYFFTKSNRQGAPSFQNQMVVPLFNTYENDNITHLKVNAYSLVQSPFSDNGCSESVVCRKVVKSVFHQYTIAGCEHWYDS